MTLSAEFTDMQDEVASWRHHLHQNPELLYDVEETAQFVESKLREFGIDDIVTGVGRTGVVARLEGNTNASDRVIGLRADMDALPIAEESGVDYASKVPGRMHACGHDAHVAILLGAAKHLARTRDFDGTVVFIFQPAEEGGAGGRAMCDDGLIARWGLQEVYALHNAPGLPIGEFAIRRGPFLASMDEFRIEVTGRGGHAAFPQKAIDSTLAAAQMNVMLNTIVSRNVDPISSVVLTVSIFDTGGNAANVIPERVVLGGMLRSHQPAQVTVVKERVQQIADHTAAALGATAKVEWTDGFPALVNHDTQTGHALRAARAIAHRVVEDADPVMASEDFAFILNECPGAYIMLGNGDSANVHDPRYVFNDNAIPYGVAYFVELVTQVRPT